MHWSSAFGCDEVVATYRTSTGGSKRELCIGSQLLDVMEVPPPMQASTSQYCGVVGALPQGIVLVENKSMWNEECTTKLASKLAS